MSIHIQAAADVDAEEAVAELASWKRSAAVHFVKQLQRAYAWLESLPCVAGRYESPSPQFPEMREYLIPKDFGYIIFYRPVEDGITVIRILHSSRNVAAIFNPGG